MPDIYGKISPATDAPEVQSTDHIVPADLTVKVNPIPDSIYATPNPFSVGGQGQVQGNDLEKLMYATDKSLTGQDWYKSELYTSPIVNTPFKQTQRYLDPKLGFSALDPDLEQKYGDDQGGWNKLFNRLLKTGATAAVSFGEGLASGINLISGKENANNKGISQANEWLERLETGDEKLFGMNVVNYQTTYQKDHPLLSYLPNPFAMKSFLDNTGKITQNLGYTIGAMASAAIVDIPVAAMTEGVGEIPLLARQSGKIFSSIGKLSRLVTGSAEEYNVYKKALQSGDDVLKALSRSADITRGMNTARFINSSVLSAYGESVVEGNSIYRETKQKLESQFVDGNGNYNGDAETTQKIEQAAKDAGKFGIKANMAFLSISNMFGLGSILRPGAAAIKATEKTLAEKVGIKLAENNINLFELVPNQAKGIKGVLKNLSRPAELILENAKEGVEEGYQTGIQSGTESFYQRKFNAGSNNQVNNLSQSINDGLSTVFTTTEGQESMLMGLLGGVVQAGLKHVWQGKKGIKSGAKLAESIKTNLNSHTVTSLFDTTRNEAVTSADIVREMQDAASSGDMFKYKNLQHQQLFNFVDSAVKSNKFDSRIEQLNALKGLSKENFESLFNIDFNEENGRTVSNYVDGLINKASSIRDEINKVDTVFGNNPYSKEKQSINYQSFEAYKGELGLALSEQKDHLRRVKTIRDSLSNAIPGASFKPLIDLASETGIKETVAGFEKRINDLKTTEALAKDNPDLTKDMVKEREYLEGKVKEINDAVDNNKTHEKEFLGTVNSLHNYFANGNSLYGDANISKLDSIDVFNKSYDINQLTENTKRIQRYYEELTSRKGFKNLAEDFGRRLSNFTDRIRVDDKGNFRVLTDEEIYAERPDKTATVEANKEYIKNRLDVASIVEGNDKIDKEDKELIAKLIDPDEQAEEGDVSQAEKIRNGSVPITQEMKDTAKARLQAEFDDATSAEEDGKEAPITTPQNASKEEIRAAKIKRAAQQKGVNMVDEKEDNSDINDMMDNDLNKKKDDIEKRRQEELSKNITEGRPDGNYLGQKDDINAKYDKELSDLGDNTVKTKVSDIVTEEAPAPTEVTNNPFINFWSKFISSPLKLLNRIFSPNFKDKAKPQYKTALDKLVLGNMSPELMHKNIISKIRLEVAKSEFGNSPDKRELLRYFPKGDKIGLLYDNLYRAGFGVDANVMIGDTQVGILHPPNSLQFKRDGEFHTLDKLRDAAEYVSVTRNPANTFDQFKKDWQDYNDAYKEAVKGFKSGEMLHVKNEDVLKIFRPVVAYGNVEYTDKVESSTLIKDLKYRGKGDAILSFPVELNEQTGKYERTTQPTILNEADLTDDQVAETLAYVGGNIANIHRQDVRYIYLMRMPDGKFTNQSVIVARPDDESDVNLEGFLGQLKSALSNEDHASYFDINRELGEAVYVAHNRRTGNQVVRKTNARFSVRRNEKKNKNSIILTIFNKGLNHNKRIEFSADEINNLGNFNDLIKLANDKITEAEKTDRILMKIGLELTPESFKKSIPNDTEVSTEDLEDKLKLSVKPNVFANTSITMMPSNGEAYVAPTIADGRKKRSVGTKTTGTDVKTTGEAKTTDAVAINENPKVGDSYNIISSTGSNDGTWKITEDKGDTWLIERNDGKAKSNVKKDTFNEKLSVPDNTAETKYRIVRDNIVSKPAVTTIGEANAAKLAKLESERSKLDDRIKKLQDTIANLSEKIANDPLVKGATDEVRKAAENKIGLTKAKKELSDTIAKNKVVYKQIDDTVPKEIAKIHVGQTYTGHDGAQNTVIKISDVEGKTNIEYVNKEGVETNAEAHSFLSVNKIQTTEAAPSSSTGTKTTTQTAPQRDYAEEVVNKNLNNIITQLKSKGLLKTDC